MPSSRLSLLTTAALLAGIAWAAPAMADPAQSVSAEIQYDNSALHTRLGAASVLDSVEDQAVSLCRYELPISSAPRVDDRCVSRIVAEAVNKIDHPSLTEAYMGKSDLAPRLVADIDR